MSSLVDGARGAMRAGVNAMLAAAARLPPRWRTTGSYRLSAAVARRTCGADQTIRTNLGIDAQLRCDVPARFVVAAFGYPELYAGERGALALAARFSDVTGTFVDVGANIGYFTFFVATRSPRARVLAFEPDPRLGRLLRENVKRNELDRVQVSGDALADADGERTFLRNLEDPLSGSLTNMFVSTHRTEAVTVHARSFRSLAASETITRACVKVDVEGAEFEFVSGAAGAFDRIGYLIMEILGPAHAAGFVQTLVARSGFRAYYINDRRVEESTDGRFAERAGEYNWLFCRDAPNELATVLGSAFVVVAAPKAEAARAS